MRLLTLAHVVRSIARERVRPIPESLVSPSLEGREIWHPRIPGLCMTILVGVVLVGCSPNSDSPRDTNQRSSRSPRYKTVSKPPPPGTASPDQATAVESGRDAKPPKDEGARKSSIPKILPDVFVRPDDDKLAEIEYLLERGNGIKVMRGWGLQVRATADDGHSMTLIACRLVGPALEDGPIVIFTDRPITPVTGVARAFSDALPNRHWSSADKAVQVLMKCAEAVRDGRSSLHSDK